jgi:hypothetical protein
MVIAPASGTGRFFRKYDRVLNARHFGATGEYPTDDTAALQAAINFAESPTYGWANYSGSFSENAALAVYIPPGTYKTTSTLTFSGCEIFGKSCGGAQSQFGHTVINCMHGGHCFTWLSDATAFRVGSIHDLNLIGFSETYQQNKKNILAVASRTLFTVSTADVPSSFSGPDNFCFFFDNEGGFLGHGIVGTVNSGTGEVTLLTNFDSYATVTAGAGFLRTADKVVFTQQYTESIVSNFLDPASAGSCGIWMKNTHASAIAVLPKVYNMIIQLFHCGIRIGPNTLGGFFENIQVKYSRFCGIFGGPAARTTDNQYNMLYLDCSYTPDYLRSPTNTFDNRVFRQGAVAFYNPGANDRIDNYIFQYGCLANIYVDRSLENTFGSGISDGTTRYGVLVRTAYYSPAQSSPWVYFGQLIVRTEFSSDQHNTLHPTAAIRIWGETPTNTARPVRISIGQLECNEGGGGPLDAAFNIDGTATLVAHTIRVSQYTHQLGVSTTTFAGSQLPEILDSRYSTDPAEIGVGPYFPSTNSKANWSVAVAGANGLSLANTGLTVNSATGTFPLTINRVDTGKAWAFNISTDILRFYNSTAGYYGLDINSNSSTQQITFGLNGTSYNPRNVTLQAEAQATQSAGSCTITIASPAVVTKAAHGYVANDQIVFSTTGALPTGITAGTVYFVIATGLTTSTFQFSTTSGGAAVNTSGTQSGVQSVVHVNAPANSMYIIASRGTGNDATQGGIGFYTADVGSSGSTAQSTSQKFKLSRYGHVIFTGQSSDPASDISDGLLYYNTTSKKTRTLSNSKFGNLDRWAITATSSTTVTVGAADELVTLSNAGAITVNLPAGILNQRYAFKNIGAGTATLTPNGAEKLFTTAQVSTLALVTGDYKLIQWDGTQWLVLN